MTNLIADLVSLGVILYMMAVLVAGVVLIPAAVVMIAGRLAGIW